jgi:hypothetical protein
MHALGTLFVHLLSTIFFIGLAGSAIVIAISFVEDFHELFGPDDPASEPTPSPRVSTNQTPALEQHRLKLGVDL